MNNPIGNNFRSQDHVIQLFQGNAYYRLVPWIMISNAFGIAYMVI